MVRKGPYAATSGPLSAALLLQVAIASPARAPASAGDLDPTFGSGGKVTTSFACGPSGFAEGRAVATQPDGKILVAGQACLGPSPDFALARYNPDGSLDASFGSGGKVTTDFGGNENANGVAIQPDGKIVAAGFTCVTFVGTSCDFALARYNPDGSLDASFGSGGKVTTTNFTGSTRNLGNAVAIEPGGKIVAAGQACIGFGPSCDFALARYNPDGSLDASFGSGGKVTTSFGATEGANALAVHPDHKIVAAGFTCVGSLSCDFALARYNPDGSLDASFGIGGKVTTDFGATDQAAGVAIQPDGKIVAAGFTCVACVGTEGDFALARYNPDGSLDANFGSGGKVTTDFGGGSGAGATAVAIHPGRMIVAAGGRSVGGDSDFALARYNPDGSLDAGFGSGGKVTTDFGGNDVARAVAIQPDGKIVAAGVAFCCSLPTEVFALARYEAR